MIARSTESSGSNRSTTSSAMFITARLARVRSALTSTETPFAAAFELVTSSATSSTSTARTGAKPSFAAAKLGFAPVHAVDVDDVALEVTGSNAAANGVAVEVGTELRPASLAVMNIALDVVERLLPELSVERAITSGYLERDEPRVNGWQRLERRVRDGWAADLLELRP